jgi:hypothetical protein
MVLSHSRLRVKNTKMGYAYIGKVGLSDRFACFAFVLVVPCALIVVIAN